MNIGALNSFPGMSGLTATPGTNAKVDPAKLATAARQFEALMIGQILKSSHGSDGGGWLGAGDDDDTSATAVQMAEEYLGQAIANGGGLGIAAMVIKGVGQNTAKGPTGGGAD